MVLATRDDLAREGFKGLVGFLDEVVEVLKGIEAARNSRVFLLFTGDYRDIGADIVESIYEVLEAPVKGDLDIVLYSNGGSADQAYLIGRFLQENVEGRLGFLVPRWAKSAATILSCSGDEIVMTRIAELGPIDPVIYIPKARRYVPALSIMELFRILPGLGLPEDVLGKILDRLPVEEVGDYNRLLEHSIETAAKLLSKRMYREDSDKALEVARRLASYKEHGAAITLYDAAEHGLRVRQAEPSLERLLVRLHRLYRERILWIEESIIQGIEEPVDMVLPENKGVIFTRKFT